MFKENRMTYKHGKEFVATENGFSVADVNGLNPRQVINPKGQSPAQVLVPNADNGVSSTILPTTKSVDVEAVTTDANDWITLPAVADVQVGHSIKIACNAGTNFELRTPTTSGELINTVVSDGTQEYLCTDTEMVTVTLVSATDGWVATAQTALGAIATAVVPD